METAVPESFTLEEEDFAVYRPVGDHTFDQTVAIVDEALAHCRANEIRRLLIDIRDVTGFPPPTTLQRFAFASKWSATAGPYVRLSMICHRELIDSEKIGVTMALNRGLSCDVFIDEPAARAWLVGPQAS